MEQMLESVWTAAGGDAFDWISSTRNDPFHPNNTTSVPTLDTERSGKSTRCTWQDDDHYEPARSTARSERQADGHREPPRKKPGGTGQRRTAAITRYDETNDAGGQ